MPELVAELVDDRLAPEPERPSQEPTFGAAVALERVAGPVVK
jgi:hypothetical protein